MIHWLWTELPGLLHYHRVSQLQLELLFVFIVCAFDRQCEVKFTLENMIHFLIKY